MIAHSLANLLKSQLAERNAIQIVACQLHMSARRATSNRSAETHHQTIQRLCKGILEVMQQHTNCTVSDLKAVSG